jgi:hypothetical protein
MSYSYAVDSFDDAGHSAATAPLSAVIPPACLITFVQGESHGLGSPGASLTFTMQNVVRAGDLLVGWFADDSAPGQLAVSDNVNGAWTRSASRTWNNSGSGDVALYYKANAAAGSITITVLPSAMAFVQATVAEYANVAAAAPIDQVATANGSGSTATAGPTGVLAMSNELVYAATNDGASVASMSPASGFTWRSNTGSAGEEDRIASSTSAQSASIAFPTSTDWNMVVATLKPAQ